MQDEEALEHDVKKTLTNSLNTVNRKGLNTQGFIFLMPTQILSKKIFSMENAYVWGENRLQPRKPLPV
jgi:hypothetical protein